MIEKYASLLSTDGHRTIRKMVTCVEPFSIKEVYLVEFCSSKEENWITHFRNTLILLPISGNFSISRIIDGKISTCEVRAESLEKITIHPMTTFRIESTSTNSKLLCLMNGIHDKMEYVKGKKGAK